MRSGDLVKLAEWCHNPGEIGVIIEADPYGKRKWENREFRIMVSGKIQIFHPDDFYVLKWEES